MIMKMLLTPVSNVTNGHVLKEDNESVFPLTHPWSKIIPVFDNLNGEETQIKVENLSLFHHQPIINGERHFILHAYSTKN